MFTRVYITIPGIFHPYNYTSSSEAFTMSVTWRLVAVLSLVASVSAAAKSSCTVKSVWPDGREEER